MAIIVETKNFIVEAAARPHIDRLDGGHIRILPKDRVRDRTVLSLTRATELMVLSLVVGEAMEIALGRRGIEIGRINYQENGNWGVFKPDGPYLHIHVYGRSKSANVQRFGHALYLPKRETGFYDSFQPLNESDVSEIRKEIESIAKSEKYRDAIQLIDGEIG